MSTEQNKTVARRYMENVMTNGNLREAFELCAPDFAHRFPGAPGPINREATEQLTRAFHEGFPDLRATIEDQVAEGDKVTSRIVFQGTHRGTFQGIPASGKPVRFTGINIARVAAGKITTLWSEFDAMGLMQQIGAIPAPGAPYA